MKKNHDLTNWGKQHITPDALPVVRDPLKQQSARQRYLAKVQAVSFSKVDRLNHTDLSNRQAGWLKKEKRIMIGQFVTIAALILGLLGGTGAATVYASQSSLPGEALYPVKTWSEDVRMDWTTDTQDKLALSLDLTDERLEEIQQLSAQDIPLSDSVLSDLQEQLDTTLNLLAQVPQDENMQQVLTRLQTQTRLMDQSQIMQQDQLMIQVRDMLQTRIQAVQAVENSYQVENQNQQQYQTSGPKTPLQQQQQLQATLTPMETEFTATQGNRSESTQNGAGNANPIGTQTVQSQSGQGNSTLHQTATPAAQQQGKGNGGRN